MGKRRANPKEGKPPLKRYRDKRQVERTREPFGAQEPPEDLSAASQHQRAPSPVQLSRPRLFVVQKHAARRMHYDLRLEWRGVLWSWAVPRGPSLDPTVKRLAVHVEDHPVEYADFEGIIPAGNYGAGNVVVWDQGRWWPVEDPDEGLRTGKLLFDLYGHKLRGRFTLVRTKRKGPAGRRTRSNVTATSQNQQAGLPEDHQGQEWLLIKKPDHAARPLAERPQPHEGGPHEEGINDTSIFTGRTVESVAAVHPAISALRRKRALRAKLPAFEHSNKLKPMLAQVATEPFDSREWLFELKLDGYRLIATLASTTQPRSQLTTLSYRSGYDATAIFPEIRRALDVLAGCAPNAVLDGEVVVLDAQGKPSFSLLQNRGMLRSETAIERAAAETPATLFVFDLLVCDGLDLRGLPLHKRKELLQTLVPGAGPVRYTEHLRTRGKDMFAQVDRLGFEGVMAKRANSPYVSGERTSDWLKIKAERQERFAIVGFTHPRGARTGIGALEVAAPGAQTWQYAGRVGTGFDQTTLKMLHDKLAPLAQDQPPCDGVPGLSSGNDSSHTSADRRPHRWQGKRRAASNATATTTWCAPKYLCNVRFKERTNDGLLRQPVFLGLVEDDELATNSAAAMGAATAANAAKPKHTYDNHHATARELQTGMATSASGPRDNTLEEPLGTNVGTANPTTDSTGNKSDTQTTQTVQLTNQDKVFWPAITASATTGAKPTPARTKGDLLAYYEAIAPYLLPYLKDRPVVLTRYPDGIAGKSFFQKDAPQWISGWVRTERMWSEHAQRDIDYFICDTVEALLFIANLGTIPLHIWSSRIGSLQQPDWCILDLDPKDAPFADVLTIARYICKLCDKLKTPHFVKTSGATGLHILLPLAQQLTYEQSRQLAELLARVTAHALPDIATVERVVSRRQGRVYVDYGQNGHGRLLVAPFSARPVPAASVSMPLRRQELTSKLDVSRYTIANTPARMQRLKTDPLADVLNTGINVADLLMQLGAMLKTSEN